jgi:ABC-2 type transport system ATP-binding protein
MNKYALTVENLTKVYSDSKNKKENKALNDLNFQVKQGEIFGLLGPNGAGKTTFLSILGGTVSKTKGNINVWGFDIDKNPRQVKASIGIVPQEVNLDAFFSPKKLLELQAGLYGVTRKDRITDLILKELNKEGVTIILTTHYLFEAQEMCDRIAIINKGNLVALDTTQKLLDRIQTKKINFKVKNIDKNKVLQMKEIQFKINSNDSISVIYEKNSLNFEEITNYLTQNNIKILDIVTEDGDLEDVFVQLTNK